MFLRPVLGRWAPGRRGPLEWSRVLLGPVARAQRTRERHPTGRRRVSLMIPPISYNRSQSKCVTPTRPAPMPRIRPARPRAAPFICYASFPLLRPLVLY